MTEKIRVLLVDDHALTRGILVDVLNLQKDIQVCWQAANGGEALRLFRQHQPDITLMDLHMPLMNGIKATAFICQEFPAACILGYTAFAEAAEIDDLLQAGAKACVWKGADTAELFHAIRTNAATK